MINGVLVDTGDDGLTLKLKGKGWHIDSIEEMYAIRRYTLWSFDEPEHYEPLLPIEFILEGEVYESF